MSAPTPGPEGWAGLDPRAGGDGSTPQEDAVATLFARVFRGSDGARALAHLRALTLDRALGPDAPPDALRHLEGQRALVLQLIGLVERGKRG